MRDVHRVFPRGVLLSLLGILLAASFLIPGAPTTNQAAAVTFNRYFLFIGGINSSSAHNDLRLVLGFYDINLQLPSGTAVYFSYSAAAHRQRGEAYCKGWVNGCSSTVPTDLSSLTQLPVYSPEDTHLPIDQQVETLHWLLGQITRRDASAVIDIIGYSLGGVVASRWAALYGVPYGIGDKIHSIILIESPVGGMIPVGTMLRDCADPLNVNPRCLTWNYVLKPRWGEPVLRALQLSVDSPTESIIDSLSVAALSYDVTSIQSTDDYFVNDVGIKIVLDSPLPIGRGAQYWRNNPQVLTERLGGVGLQSGPEPIITAQARIEQNHSAPLHHAQTAQRVILVFPQLAAQSIKSYLYQFPIKMQI